MYKATKNLITLLFPRKVLFKYEEKLRSIYSVFHSGNDYSCPICLKKLSRFVKSKNDDSICPNCGSLKRNRRLWLLLDSEFLQPEMKILDFSPSRCLYRKLKKRTEFDYVSTDLSRDFIADNQWDITRIAAPDSTFDLLICYHVLEHVKEDVLAMNELFRILKPKGKILVQTPFKEGDTYENEAVISEEDRLIHFGQEDHVRIYSVLGLKERAEKCGFLVEVRTYTHEKNQFDLSINETILVFSKP